MKHIIKGKLTKKGHTIYIHNKYGYDINLTRYLADGFHGRNVEIEVEEKK